MADFLRPFFVLLLWLSTLAAGPAWADPPGRVGRLSLVAGEVVLRGADDSAATEAGVNWPLTDGDVVATGTDGRAEIRVGSSVLRLDRDTELAIQRVDDEHIRVWLEYGSLALRVRNPERANAIEVETRDGIAVAAEPGQYRIDAGADGLVLSAYHGRFRFQGRDAGVVVTTGERVVPGYGDAAEVGAAEYDDFAEWSLALDRRDDAREPPRYVSREMTGVEDLQAYGEWDHDASYGAVWFPRGVHSDWAPYRWGRWVHLEPWGWTWVDDAPWGFAPFHYGRWVLVRGRWGWLPGRYVARPIYAPALVVWIGSSDWEVDFVFGRRPAVGWFPLGPREVYVPGYRCSTTYVRRINVTHVTETTRITEVVRAPDRHRHHFRHQPRAVTVVPRESLAEAKPIAPVAVRDPAPWARTAPLLRAVPGFVERDTGRDRHEAFSRHAYPRPDGEHRVSPREATRHYGDWERFQRRRDDERRDTNRRREAEARRGEAWQGVVVPDRRSRTEDAPAVTIRRQAPEPRRGRAPDADAFHRFQAERRGPDETTRRVEEARREAARAEVRRGVERREHGTALESIRSASRGGVEREAQRSAEDTRRRERERGDAALAIGGAPAQGERRGPVQLPFEPRGHQRDRGDSSGIGHFTR